MCNFCDERKETLLKQEVVSDTSWGWGNPEVKINYDEACKFNLSVFIDCGFLRLVDEYDCGCLDHGEKIAINFCPMCGERLNKSF